MPSLEKSLGLRIRSNVNWVQNNKIIDVTDGSFYPDKHKINNHNTVGIFNITCMASGSSYSKLQNIYKIYYFRTSTL